MGGWVSKLKQLFSTLVSTRDRKIIFLGLDAAGKTTILYKLKLGEVVTTIPTIGFNVETVEYKRMSITAWDVGSRDKIRPLWRHYYQGLDAFVWVVDASDRARIDDGEYPGYEGSAKQELWRVMEHAEVKHIPVLVMANKCDLPGAMRADEVTHRLGLRAIRTRAWYVQPTCAVTGDGLLEGMDWLYQQLIKQPNPYAATTAHDDAMPSYRPYVSPISTSTTGGAAAAAAAPNAPPFLPAAKDAAQPAAGKLAVPRTPTSPAAAAAAAPRDGSSPPATAAAAAARLAGAAAGAGAGAGAGAPATTTTTHPPERTTDDGTAAEGSAPSRTYARSKSAAVEQHRAFEDAKRVRELAAAASKRPPGDGREGRPTATIHASQLAVAAAAAAAAPPLPPAPTPVPAVASPVVVVVAEVEGSSPAAVPAAEDAQPPRALAVAEEEDGGAGAAAIAAAAAAPVVVAVDAEGQAAVHDDTAVAVAVAPPGGPSAAAPPPPSAAPLHPVSVGGGHDAADGL